MTIIGNQLKWRTILQLVIALVFSITVLSSVVHCQTIPYVTFDTPIRNYLVQAWDAHLADNPMLERAYCVRYTPVVIGDEMIYQINAIKQADSIIATPEMISYQCPSGKGYANLHIHTPQTCLENGCVMGGRDAYACQPSEVDQESLDRSIDKFSLIQCDRMAVVSYWPKRRR